MEVDSLAMRSTLNTRSDRMSKSLSCPALSKIHTYLRVPRSHAGVANNMNTIAFLVYHGQSGRVAEVRQRSHTPSDTYRDNEPGRQRDPRAPYPPSAVPSSHGRVSVLRVGVRHRSVSRVA